MINLMKFLNYIQLNMKIEFLWSSRAMLSKPQNLGLRLSQKQYFASKHFRAYDECDPLKLVSDSVWPSEAKMGVALMDGTQG